MSKQKKDNIKSKCLIRVEGTHAFHRGDTFMNFEEVADRLQEHTQESLVYYWIRDSRLVRCAHTKTSRKIDDRLLYYTIRFSCIFGGQRFKSKAAGIRPSRRKSRQIDCPAFISLRATKCGRKLEVIDVCNDHTHEISEQAVQELPQKRRPSQGLLEEVQELLQLNVDKKMIIEYVKQKENKNILKKDLFNMAMHMRMRMRQDRHVDEQNMILQRIKATATEEDIQQAVLRRLLQLDSHLAKPSPHPLYIERVKTPENTLDDFDANTPSAIDFTTLPAEMDLLGTTDGVQEEIDKYDELLSNPIIDCGEDDALEGTISKPESSVSPSEENYTDFICGNESDYTYNELELRQEQRNNRASSPSNHSHDLDDKDYFNDIILTSPDGEIYPADICLSTSDRLQEQEYQLKEQHQTEYTIENCTATTSERIKWKEMPKFCTEKTRRVIMKCRNCGTNARLMSMQISYLKQQRQKLILQTQVLRLKKKKLKTEIEAVRRSN